MQNHEDLLRHPAHRRQAPRQPDRRLPPVRGDQEQGEAFFCIVDLHSITVDYDPDDLRRSTLDLAALLFATGLDPERSTVFCQSHVTAHAEAAWLLSAVTSYGQLGRMTQFKEKGDRQEFVSAGLFTYPVLMAGDILLYQTDIVPIGDDQRQHLELSRDVAERFNARFGETFVVPRVSTRGRRPDHGPAGAGEEDVHDGRHGAGDRLLSTSRTRSAASSSPPSPTPAGRSAGRRTSPGSRTWSTSCRSRPARRRRQSRHASRTRLRRFKEAVGEAVVALLAPIQERFRGFREDEAELRRLLAIGAEKAREASAPTLATMYERMGFVER